MQKSLFIQIHSLLPFSYKAKLTKQLIRWTRVYLHGGSALPPQLPSVVSGLQLVQELVIKRLQLLSQVSQIFLQWCRGFLGFKIFLLPTVTSYSEINILIFTFSSSLAYWPLQLKHQMIRLSTNRYNYQGELLHCNIYPWGEVSFHIATLLCCKFLEAHKEQLWGQSKDLDYSF